MTDRCTRLHSRGACALLLLVMLAALASPAQAQLRVEITSGVTDPIPVAIVPFAGAAAFDAAAIIERDLVGTGRFKAFPRESMPAQPGRGDQVVAVDWRSRGNDFVLVATQTTDAAGATTLDYELLNVLTGQRLLRERIVAPANASGQRNAAHRIADRVHERILGVRGAFATRIAYVSVDGRPPNQRFQLIVADADGEGPRIVLESREPLMSPAWSPDGEWLAYVSFEGRVSSIFVQRVRTGERRRVSARAGVNGAPAFSPDGQRLALTLSGSGGNLDIWLLDLATQQLTRLTDDAGIDTEPSWTPDGRELFFTSDRAGTPQIYRIGVSGGLAERPRRVTFGSNYAARPRVAPDGKSLAFVTLEGGGYRIALQDLATGVTRTVTTGRFDESPSFAPNGASVLYAGRDRGQGVLAAVSADGLASRRLKADQGDVREPAWGPFLP